MIDAYIAETPLGRIGEPADVARVVRFLARPDSGWVTGQTFSADGGLDQGKGADPMDAIFGVEAMKGIRAGRPGWSGPALGHRPVTGTADFEHKDERR